MGGKTKQSQRTKNNVRPSSSGRSAELLSGSASGRLDAGLVVAGGKALPALFPSLAGAPLDVGLTAEFSLCLKKLNKKDPITKTKALQELTELVKNSKVDDVAAALPGWTHFYRILSVDTDRKVREATQVCHEAIVSSCGRRIAPHLKQLLPAWLQAQHDEHPPAQCVAQASLTNTFPESKLPEVISFCRVEVASYLIDNISGGIEAAVNKKTEDPELRAQLYSTQMSCSLSGLEYLAQRIPDEHAAWLWDQLAPPLQASAFWKLAAHPQPTLRSSWYLCVGAIVSRWGPQFGALCGQRAARLLLSARETGRAAATLWACLLQLLHAAEDWHKWIDKKDLLVKRIMDMLENGGWGSARRLSDVLLPLLARLPADMLTHEFLHDFFTAAFTGLEKKAVLSSKSERQAWITSISECLRYVSIQEQEFVPALVSRVLRDWLETALKCREEPLASHLLKHCAASMAALNKYWLKRSRDDDRYDLLVRSFWQNVTATILADVDKASGECDDVALMMDRHVTLLLTLQAALTQDTKKQRSIKFEGDSEASPAAPPSPPPPPALSPPLATRYTHNLHECAQRAAAAHLRLATRAPRRAALLPPLRRLLRAAPLYRSVALELGAESVYSLYSRELRPWLQEGGGRAVVDLVFALVPHVDEHEHDRVFDSFDEMSAEVVEWCISAAVRHPVSALGAARRWLAGACVRDAVLRAARRVLRASDPSDDLLLTCLAMDERGELLLGSETVQGVIAECCDAMEQRVRDVTGRDDVTPGELEPVARFGAALCTSLAPHAPHLLPALVAALFRLTLAVPLGGAALSADTWREAVCSWQDALPHRARDALLCGAVRDVTDMLLDDMDNLDITKIENITYLCPFLLSQSDSPALDELVALTRRMFAQLFAEHSTNIVIHALRHDCVVSNLNCPIEDCDVIKQVIDESSSPTVKELTKETLMPYVYRVLFRALYLRTILLRKPGVVEEEDDDDGEKKEEDESEPSWCDTVLADEAMVEELCNVLYDHAVVCSLHEGYAYWRHSDIIDRTRRKLDAVVADIAAQSAAARGGVRAALAGRAAESGYYWALASRRYERGGGGGGGEQLDPCLDQLLDSVTGSGYFHCLQAAAALGSDAETRARSLQLQVVRCTHAAHAHEPGVLGAFTHSAAACLQPPPRADFIVDLYYTHNHVMLYEREIVSASWQQVVSNTATCEYLRALVESHGWDLPAHHWDFTTITLCSLLSSVEKSKHAWGSTKVAMLTLAALRLFVSVAQFIADVPAQSQRRRPADHVAALPTEWRDIFAPDTHLSLLSLLTHVLETGESVSLTSSHTAVVAALQDALPHAQHALVPAHARARGEGGRCSLRRLASLAADVLAAPAPGHHALKYLAHDLLTNILKPLVLDDAEKLAQWSNTDSEEEDRDRQRPEFALSYLQPALTRLHDQLDEALAHVRPGEEVCCPEPHGRTHALALGCLLLDTALFSACRLQRNDLTLHYIEMFREATFPEQQLTLSLRLLPGEVAEYALDSGSSPAPQVYCAAFLQDHHFSALQAATGRDVSKLACRALQGAVSGAGAARARGWWGCAAPRPARALERLVRAYLAPALVRDHLAALHDRRAELPDTEVTIHWSTQEAVCVYQVEERALALSVTLSRAHPLVPPRAAAPPGQAHSPAPSTGWLALYLAYQNGTLLNALKMWCGAVSARVEAAPQCYICYCRLHPASGRLPTVLCHQCRNKFHSQCLRKWFTSSNKSNCPLCRSAF